MKKMCVACERVAMCEQALKNRIPDLETLQSHIAAWNADKNASGKPVNWQFTTDNARTKLKRLYPQI